MVATIIGAFGGSGWGSLAWMALAGGAAMPLSVLGVGAIAGVSAAAALFWDWSE